jgi:hypothetical protein
MWKWRWNPGWANGNRKREDLKVWETLKEGNSERTFIRTMERGNLFCTRQKIPSKLLVNM